MLFAPAFVSLFLFPNASGLQESEDDRPQKDEDETDGQKLDFTRHGRPSVLDESASLHPAQKIRKADSVPRTGRKFPIDK
ncbi:MAG: hypothetical protein HY243_13370 [Proteobacteria bacterium]|nr:hypothetical protein [Pseudomonadota bacterium]